MPPNVQTFGRPSTARRPCQNSGAVALCKGAAGFVPDPAAGRAAGMVDAGERAAAGSPGGRSLSGGRERRPQPWSQKPCGSFWGPARKPVLTRSEGRPRRAVASLGAGQSWSFLGARGSACKSFMGGPRNWGESSPTRPHDYTWIDDRLSPPKSCSACSLRSPSGAWSTSRPCPSVRFARAGRGAALPKSYSRLPRASNPGACRRGSSTSRASEPSSARSRRRGQRWELCSPRRAGRPNIRRRIRRRGPTHTRAPRTRPAIPCERKASACRCRR